MIHYRVLSIYGKPFDQVLIEEPWRVYDVLVKAMGRHNADMFLNILKNWLEKNQCNVSLDELKKFLTSRDRWP